MELVFIVLVFGTFLWLKIYGNIRNDREWHSGLFEEEENTESYSEDPLLEAYISLGALMIRKDRSAYSEKILYLNSYFAKNFPHSHYDFGRSFVESLKNPVQPKTINKWLKRKLPGQEQRIQILYFLAGLSTVDGTINQRERGLLQEMCTLLGLAQKDLDSIIAMYTQRKERKKHRKSAKTEMSTIQLACKVLGVSLNATKIEIKKAYRKLVKLHHPDLFATESVEQQEIAEERFKEIQNAYDILENR